MFTLVIFIRVSQLPCFVVVLGCEYKGLLRWFQHLDEFFLIITTKVY